MSVAQSRAPSSTNALAVVRPIPPAGPVTSTTLSAKRFSLMQRSKKRTPGSQPGLRSTEKARRAISLSVVPFHVSDIAPLSEHKARAGRVRAYDHPVAADAHLVLTALEQMLVVVVSPDVRPALLHESRERMLDSLSTDAEHVVPFGQNSVRCKCSGVGFCVPVIIGPGITSKQIENGELVLRRDGAGHELLVRVRRAASWLCPFGFPIAVRAAAEMANPTISAHIGAK